MPNAPTFSVIIPALNEEHYIPTILTSLTQQTFTDFEVIVVDAQSTDKTISVSEKFKDHLNLKVITNKLKNLSSSRNLGAGLAKGKFCFFIDADNDIPPYFFEKAHKILANSSIDAIIPRLIPSNHKLIDRLFYRICFYNVCAMLYTPRPYSTGGNLIIRREIFTKVGGFDTKVFIAEDHDMIRRLKKSKAHVKTVTHPHVVFSTRRFDLGRFSNTLKYSYSFLYLLFHNKIEKKIYMYNMGGDNFKPK